jgi:hypothetical protein
LLNTCWPSAGISTRAPSKKLPVAVLLTEPDNVPYSAAAALAAAAKARVNNAERTRGARRKGGSDLGRVFKIDGTTS